MGQLGMLSFFAFIMITQLPLYSANYPLIPQKYFKYKLEDVLHKLSRILAHTSFYTPWLIV